MISHDTFVIERTYPVPPARVFAAFADDDLKRRWFYRDDQLSYEDDFRVAGKATSRSRFAGGVPGGPPAGTIMGNDTVYMDIVPNERIVFAYSMLVGDYRMSTSLATVQLVAEGNGTRLVFTEQGAYYDKSDGAEMRKHGWAHLLERIAGSIA